MGVDGEMRNGHTTQYSSRAVIVGVDEAGRGPIAGPVSVGAVAFLKPFDALVFEGVRDSKQLSPPRRSYFRSVVESLSEAGTMSFAVRSVDAGSIDQGGIVPAIRTALEAALSALSLAPHEVVLKLDGSLRAPTIYKRQETIIRGDEIELPITLAGIMAKTTRDALMEEYARDFPQYGFEKHKGYGTKLHYQAIREHGLCPLHRASFIDLTNLHDM